MMLISEKYVLRILIFTQAVLCCAIISNAQQSSNIRLKVESGVLWDYFDGKEYISGPFLNVEPKLNVTRSGMIGLMLEGAINTQMIIASSPNQFKVRNDVGRNGVVSVGPTFDFYFNTGSNNRPYVGVGVIYSFLNTTKKGFSLNNSFNDRELEIDNQLGFLVRIGLNLYNVRVGKSDLSKLILGIKFNYIPESDVRLDDESVVATVSSSNVALSFGYLFGDKE